MRSQLLKSVCIALAGVLFVPLAARASISLTADAPGVQSSQVAGVVTETFNEFSTGHDTTLDSAVGTFTAPSPGLEIVAANEYGGAGGTGKYMAIGVESGEEEADLALNAPATYVGFWLSALDSYNVVKIYSGATLLATYDYADFNAMESASGFKGNPNSDFLDQDSGQPYGYFNITATGGTTFNKVEFYNGTTSATGEELDNISVLCAGGPAAGPSVPLPAAAWTGFGMLGCLAAMGLLRRRNSLTA